MKTLQTIVLFISVNYINPSKCTFLYFITSKVTFSTNINKVVMYTYIIDIPTYNLNFRSCIGLLPV